MKNLTAAVAALAALCAYAGVAHAQFAPASPNTVVAGPPSGVTKQPPSPRALVGADLPLPSASSLGGVESIASTSHSWIDSISTAGVPHQSQPGFSDLSGSIAASQCTLFGSSSNGCVGSSGGGTVNFLRADGTWATPTGGGSVNVQSGNYTIATSDCNNTVLANGTLQTITLPAVTGFSVPCTIKVKNSNPSRAQKLSGFPTGIAVNSINWCGSGNMCLPPNQTVEVQLVAGAWFATQVIDRWRPNGVTVFADAVNGSDNNDCLASGTAACATLQQAFNIACTFTDSQSTTIISFTGTMHNFLSGGCGVPRLIQINGSGTAIIDDNNTPGVAFECDDLCQIQLGAGGALVVEALAANSANVAAQRGGLVDINNVTFTTTAGANAAMIKAVDAANVNLNSGNTFAGGGGTTIGFFANASRGGHIVTGATNTVTGTWTVTDGCIAASGGVVDATNGAFSGGTVTGNRATAATAGGVNAATSCPGNANTTATSPGWLN